MGSLFLCLYLMYSMNRTSIGFLSLMIYIFFIDVFTACGWVSRKCVVLLDYSSLFMNTLLYMY